MKGILAAREQILHILSISRTQSHSFRLSLLHESHSFDVAVFHNAAASPRLALPPPLPSVHSCPARAHSVSTPGSRASASEAGGLGPDGLAFGRSSSVDYTEL